MSKRVEHQVLTHLRRHQLWQHHDSVVVAVSGGVDSMVLLHILQATQRSHRGHLQVVTFNHGLRTESTSEVEMVQQQCAQWNLACTIHELHLDKGPNLQARAREARRAFLLNLDGVIATGHHASDQAETVFFRLLRGSGLDGLQGLRPKYGRWVKPLLPLYKSEIVDYAHQNNLQWCEDPSNSETTRGAIRQLWPHLESIRSNPEKAMSVTGMTLARDADFISECVNTVLTQVMDGNGLKIVEVHQHHSAIQVRVIQKWLWMQEVEASHRQLEDLLHWRPQQNGQQIQLSRTVRVEQRNDVWWLCGG
jgi:tRNA(Ile)-lysidine synthase